jgi:hypothetical protein
LGRAAGAAKVANNLGGALKVIDRSEELVKMTLVVMMTPE